MKVIACVLLAAASLAAASSAAAQQRKCQDKALKAMRLTFLAVVPECLQPGLVLIVRGDPLHLIKADPCLRVVFNEVDLAGIRSAAFLKTHTQRKQMASKTQRTSSFTIASY